MSTKLPTSLFLLSIFIVTIFFVGFVFFVYHIVNSVPSNSSLISSNILTSQPTSLSLNIDNPEPDALVFNNSLLISGTTTPNSVVIITQNSQDQSLEADSKGRFSTTLNLEDGINKLTITSFDNEGNSKSETRTVYFSTEKI